MNKCIAPKIPHLLVNNLSNLNCREKAKLFTDVFSQQCKPVINHSVLPNFNYLTNEKIERIPIQNNDIISLIRKLNPTKANGSDGMNPTKANGSDGMNPTKANGSDGMNPTKANGSDGMNPTKANGSDGKSRKMLLLCDDSVLLPLRIISRNILSTAVYVNDLC